MIRRVLTGYEVPDAELLTYADRQAVEAARREGVEVAVYSTMPLGDPGTVLHFPADLDTVGAGVMRLRRAGHRHIYVLPLRPPRCRADVEAEVDLPEADQRVLAGSERYGYAVAVYSVGPTGRSGVVRNLSREAAVRLAARYRAAGHRQVHLSPDTCG